MDQQNTGIQDNAKAICMEAETIVAAPIPEVFEFWRHLENFPRFMNHVKEVRSIGDNRYHWRVDGPMGAEMSWEAEVTQVVPQERIAWASLRSAQLDNEGSVEFKPMANGSTQISVKLLYSPPAGALGHAVATLFGKNPAQQMEGDLQRCKELLERGITVDGVTTADAQERPVAKPH